MFLLFLYFPARLAARVCFHLPGRNRKSFPFARPSSRQTDRQTAWEGSEGSRRRGRRVYQSGGPVCREIGSLAIYPLEPLARSIYGNTTDTGEIQADPLASPHKATGVGGRGRGGGDLQLYKYQIQVQLGGNSSSL